ncbi:MAG: macro domain-containing protein [Kiritimatiellales bacterium]
MGIHFLRKIAFHYLTLFFTTLGIVWLFIEIFRDCSGIEYRLSFWQIIGGTTLLTFIPFFISGFCTSGFLRCKVEITSNAFNTKIIIKFSDLFKQKGFKAIAVNNFFDSTVDERLVSSKSLHGIMLTKYWKKNVADWNQQVDTQLASKTKLSTSPLKEGKQDQYEVGTTVFVTLGQEKFFCVVLGQTDNSTLEAKTTASDLIRAIRGLLCHARSVCSNEVLNIPLFGNGLSRVDIKCNVLVDLILTAIFEEMKLGRITEEIKIILPRKKFLEIDLCAVKRNWS